MSPSLSFLDSFYEEKQANTVHYLADINTDEGPDEPDLSQYVEANCYARRLRRADRKQGRAQTFRRRG